MAKIEKDRKSCKDVYKSYLVEDAYFDGLYEIPTIKGIKDIEFNNLVLFSDRNINPQKGRYNLFLWRWL